MHEKRKIWLAVGAAVLGTTTAANAHNNSNDLDGHQQHNMTIIAPFAGAGEGEGEGEGEGSGMVDLRVNDSAYLARLGLIRGHLYVGKKLYDQGHLAMAKTHMKHPEDELYAALVPAFSARGVEGFGDHLNALADAVNQEQGDDAVNAAYDALIIAIKDAEQVQRKEVKDVLMSLSTMLLTAGEEYDIGVKSGEVVNVHEFQDAYGFTTIARSRLDELTEVQREANAEAIAEVEAILASLPPLWPTITPEGKVAGDSSALYGAAARIELATLN
ncbi:hypothetical protein [Pseudidiomarina insulisalsae]|uniref:DUF2884 domain-containing protein n=1 Tax=Pseudidiomarina insulisalsae TaxID=575789 RepID=A0A432YMH6_9GAMM|nr:hypothetical protein [Pseudidiomarina insulisalsae]RUO62150.1 hypothetical protein CWI71_04680 [Pseudidiomarina insulisalsae]